MYLTLISSTYTYPLPTYTFPTHTATPTYMPPNPKMLVSSSNIFYIFQFSLPTFSLSMSNAFLLLKASEKTWEDVLSNVL